MIREEKASIQLRDVRINLGKYNEFGPISLKVKQGNWLGIVAPAGSGKSLLARVIAGLLKPDSGSRSLIYGIDKSANPIKFPVSQIRSGLVRYLTGSEPYEIEEKVIQTLKVRAILRGFTGSYLNKALDFIIERFNLAEILDKRFYQLEKGVRRRVAIAEVLIGNPAFVVFDDPFWVAENTQTRKIIEGLIKYRERENLGVVIATRSSREISGLVDNIVELGENGNMIFDGKTQDWMKKRARTVVYKISAKGKGGDIMRLLAKINGIHDIVWFEGGMYNSFDVYMDDNVVIREKIFKLFSQCNFPILELSPQKNPAAEIASNKKNNKSKTTVSISETDRIADISAQKTTKLLEKSRTKSDVLKVEEIDGDDTKMLKVSGLKSGLKISDTALNKIKLKKNQNDDKRIELMNKDTQVIQVDKTENSELENEKDVDVSETKPEN